MYLEEVMLRLVFFIVSGRGFNNKWQPTPVFLPGQSYGQRSLAGYSPRGCSWTRLHD